MAIFDSAKLRILFWCGLTWIVLIQVLSWPCQAQSSDEYSYVESSAEVTPELVLIEPDIVLPWWKGEFHVGTVLTLQDKHSCPQTLECVVGDGVLIGGTFEYQFPTGFAFAFGYDMSLLNGNSVYEVTIVQILKGGIRYVFLPDNSFRPKIGADAGFLILGDTFEVDTIGASLDGIIGAEWEINSQVALAPSIFSRFVTLSRFETRTDQGVRANRFGVDVVLGIQVGLLFLNI